MGLSINVEYVEGCLESSGSICHDDFLPTTMFEYVQSEVTGGYVVEEEDHSVVVTAD